MTLPELIGRLQELALEFHHEPPEARASGALFAKISGLAFAARHEFPHITEMLRGLNRHGANSEREHFELTLSLIAENISLWNKRTAPIDLQLLDEQKKALKKIQKQYSDNSEDHMLLDYTLWLLDQIQAFAKLHLMANNIKAKLTDFRIPFIPGGEEFEALSGVIHLLDHVGDQFEGA